MNKDSNKPVIGILLTLKEKENYPYDSIYKIASTYIKKIEKIDCIPLGLMNVEKNKEILNLCDAFIMPGGNRVLKDHYYIIKHCIEENKPLLGICVGMQAMIFYDYLLDKVKEANVNKMYEKYKELKEEKIDILEEVDSIHGKELSSGIKEATKENITKSKHKINIEKNSILYKIYEKENIEVISLHKYGVKSSTKIFRKIAYAEDKVVEAVEYKDNDYFILGVQYHPEIEDNPLFEGLKKEVKKRIKNSTNGLVKQK